MIIECISLKKTFVWIFLMSCILSSNVSFSQTNIKKLEIKRAANQREIRYTNDLLKRTIKNKNNSIGALSLLKKKIQLRNTFIKHIDSELTGLNSKINHIESNVDSLNLTLDRLKTSYADLARHVYKKRNSYNKLMFIMSSENFSQAYRRYKYYQQISEYSKQQFIVIKEKSYQLAQTKISLQTNKATKIKLQKEKINERIKLSKEKAEKSDVLLSLQQKEKELKKNLQKREKQSVKLNKEIQRIIELQTKRNKNVNKTNTSKSITRLSNSFARNKGKLPWPTKTGFLSSRFGVHTHPVLKYVKVKNDGIDITTKTNSPCYSVFNGRVEQVISIPGLNNVVIISHGDYYSVYSNLINVIIKPSDKITTGQKIGIVAKNEESGQTIIKLQIWKLSTKLNPKIWLRNK